MPEVDVKPEEVLMVGILNKLTTVLTGNLEGMPSNTNNFVAWLTPGKPIKRSFFDFGSNDSSATPSEDKEYAKNLNEWSILANYVTSGSPLTMSSNLLQTRYDTSQNLTWRIMKEVIVKSQVAKANLSDEEKSKLEQYQKELDTKGPLWKTYLLKQTAYHTALKNYMSGLISFERASSSEAVLEWRMFKGKILKDQLTTALSEWDSEGQRGHVENMLGEVQQLQSRNLVVFKKAISDSLDASMQTGELGEFYPASVIPSEILKTEGWGEYEFTEKDFSSVNHAESTAWGGSGSFRMGFWEAGANASSGTASTYASLSSEGFNFKCKFTQAQIFRGDWFDVSFLTGRGWKWAPGFEGYDLSDGKVPPSGHMVAYPTTVLLASDISITSSSFKSEESTYKRHFEAGGSVGYGPFSFGGSYSHDESGGRSDYKIDNGTLTSEGVQIIGFICHMFTEKTPNPLENADYE